ncbi:class Ib ribonucleoside-diphosphate reductase assembly flavoprotein NrdI [Corynebacterium guaraldiae]|uniref:class Ib ribonucleoside-diphosphate reductase assembly flavoprotein NrdI n=1 Tax=Corynebacterium guaraldiae TaxID=3051103 RepID=UPI00163DB4FA|nr:class Ib ribonucleoside-diphosphate reductase assembly flavoprotein NrdI [Corynebacterium guaraldiae]
MSKPEVLYWSSTGVTRRVAEEFNGKPLDSYEGGDYVLVLPTYGAPGNRTHAPASVKRMLSEHRNKLVGVIGVGNTNFGADFCALAIYISREYRVPLIACVDLFLTQDNYDDIQDFLGRC